MGIPGDSVPLLVPSASTFTDAHRIREYVATHGISRILVVTDPYHTRRARWMLGRVLGDSGVEIRMVPSDVPGTDPDRWWQDESQFLWVYTEYLKLAYYFSPLWVTGRHRASGGGPHRDPLSSGLCGGGFLG